MLSIARQTDYATRIVLHLSHHPNELVPISELSQAKRLPIPFVRRIVGKLVETGILRTVRGKCGGIGLARQTSEISLGDVVQAMEGSIRLNACVDAEDSCSFSHTCPAHKAWTETSAMLDNHLRTILFSDLAQDRTTSPERNPTWTR
jgi:Rrf2 family protein